MDGCVFQSFLFLWCRFLNNVSDEPGGPVFIHSGQGLGYHDRTAPQANKRRCSMFASSRVLGPRRWGLSKSAVGTICWGMIPGFR